MKACSALCVFLIGLNGLFSQELKLTVEPIKEIRKQDRSQLLGLNIATYNHSGDFSSQTQALLNDLSLGLIRIPGGSVSDHFYWNGHGVVTGATSVDQNKYLDGYWQVDFSDYQPGFSIDKRQWWKAFPQHVKLDAKEMHEITLRHPMASNYVTVNAGTGTAELAAEWVKWAKKNHYRVSYWEIGNELNGEWEAGHYHLCGNVMTAELYAARYLEFAKAMKAVDPTIKIGGPSTDITHSDYTSVLLEKAGNYVDFISFHSYSTRDSLEKEESLFQKPREVAKSAAILRQQIKTHQPQREGKIELSISEWNSKLPQDHHSYEIFNGLWFSAYIGEMFKSGIHSATMWDTFSSNPNGGHGLLFKQNGQFEPTSRYWAFWLWSHHMGDTLLSSHTAKEVLPLYQYVTKTEDGLSIMLINTSSTEDLEINLDFKNYSIEPMATLVEFGPRQYFWNPHAQKIEWNQKPSVQPILTTKLKNHPLAPQTINIIKVKNQRQPDPTLELVLPSTHPWDVPLKGYVKIQNPNRSGAYQGSISSKASLKCSEADLGDNVIRVSEGIGAFSIKAQKPGPVEVMASWNHLSTTQQIQFLPVTLRFEPWWDFNTTPNPSALSSSFKFELNQQLKVHLKASAITPPQNKFFQLGGFPKEKSPKAIGGIQLDLALSEGFSCQDREAELVFALQSDGAYWIPLGNQKISGLSTTQRTISFEISDKSYLEFMNKVFCIFSAINCNGSVSGTISVDNLGFLMRDLP